MGQEISCIIRLGNQQSSGTAHLDTDTLRFRGEFRLKIPFAEITTLEATNGTLLVAFPDGIARFELGHRAEKWADAIRNPRSLFDKLGVKPGQRIATIGVTDADFLAQLQERVPDTLHTNAVGVLAGGEVYDLLFLAVEQQLDLECIPALVPHLRPAAGLWIVAPKGQRHLTEMDVLLAGRASGLKEVKVARFSQTHTAHKFVIPLERR